MHQSFEIPLKIFIPSYCINLNLTVPTSMNLIMDLETKIHTRTEVLGT